MNPIDILAFLKPDFSDLLQASFFGVMVSMLLLTVLSVSITAWPRAWEKKWNRASHSKSGASQGIEQGGVTDLFHIVATRPEKLAEVMPGMLLIVGLLGTFIGLGLALDKASSILGASNAMDAVGAADGLQNMLGMLNGLGTKFKTSTWGIAGFILMKVWSEVTQFEEKRLAWVMGKVKKDSEARNARILATEAEKWQKSVQFGSALTSELTAAFEKGIEKSVQAAAHNNHELLAKYADFMDLSSSDSRAAQQSAKERSERMEALLSAMAKQSAQIAQQQATLSQHNMKTMGELFTSQIKAMSDQQTADMGENTRLIALLSDNMQSVADASLQTNAAMQDFTANTQKVVSNMDSAAQRMASGADNVGTAAQDLLGAVTKFEQQFTEVLNNVRTDLGRAISEMSSQASQTLEVGSQKLSDSTIQISKSLEQLSSDVTTTMTEVRESIEQALSIQRKASEEIIASSNDFRTGIHEITANIENLASPIEDGLAAISKSNAQMKTVVSQVTNGLNSAVEINRNLGELTAKISHFEGIPQTNEKLASGLKPLKDIQTSLNEVCSQISNRPQSETGIAREINEKLGIALSPLNEIQSLLKDMRSDLANRPVERSGFMTEAQLKGFLQQIPNAITNAFAQQNSRPSPEKNVVLSNNHSPAKQS